jgi:uncharacterized protein YfkK (UPF0435 family)
MSNTLDEDEEMKLSDIPERDEGSEEDDENDSSSHEEDEEDENNRSEDTGSEVDSTEKVKKEIPGNSADDDWIKHNAEEYVILRAWRGRMKQDDQVQQLEIGYYFNDNRVWLTVDGEKNTKNVNEFPNDDYKIASDKWEELRHNYRIIEQKKKFVNSSAYALIEELRLYELDGSRQLYHYNGSVWIYKGTLPNSTTEGSNTEEVTPVAKRPGFLRRVVNSFGKKGNTNQLLMDLEALGKSII